MGHFNQGYFKPVHPEKYVGDINKIVYRSSWELSMNQFLDKNTSIKRWSSESIKIPYIKPTDGKVHSYYPDYWVEYVDNNNNIICEIIEIKPKSQTLPPKGKSKSSQYAQITYAINIAKWEHAIKWCNEHGLKFRIITENQLFK
jgi:hypothetical protein